MSGIPVSELIKFAQEHPVEYELPEERTPLQKKDRKGNSYVTLD